MLKRDCQRWTLAHRTSDGILGIWGSARDDVWAVGRGGMVLHYDGTSWRPYDTPQTDLHLSNVFGIRSDSVWAGGYGTLMHWDGSTWTRIPDPRPAEWILIEAIWASADDDVYVVSGDGIWHWDGDLWTLDRVMGIDFSGIHGSSANHVAAAAGVDHAIVVRERH